MTQIEAPVLSVYSKTYSVVVFVFEDYFSEIAVVVIFDQLASLDKANFETHQVREWAAGLQCSHSVRRLSVDCCQQLESEQLIYCLP